MRSSAKSAVLAGLLLLGWLPMFAAGRRVQVCVRDPRGDAIAGARVLLRVEPAADGGDGRKWMCTGGCGGRSSGEGRGGASWVQQCGSGGWRCVRI